MEKNFVLWLTGLSAAGKTTIAKRLYQEIIQLDHLIHHLDGDEVRRFSPIKLGFSPQERDLNIQLAINLAKKYQDNGISVIASFITPYQRHREWARSQLRNYIEVFVSTPLCVCEARDPKGLYRKARAGEVNFFTGISDIYEEPSNPHIHLPAHKLSLDESVSKVLKFLRENGYIKATKLS